MNKFHSSVTNPEKMQHVNDESPVFMNVIKYLRNLSVWPENGEIFHWKNGKKFFTALIISLIPTFVGLTGHIYVSLKGPHIADLVNDIVYILLFTIYASCGLFYILCCKKLGDIIRNINHPKHGKPENFDRLAERIEFLTTFIHHYVFCIASSYILFFLLADTECKSKKIAHIEESLGYVCGLPTPAWFPINLNFFLWKYFLVCCNAFILVYILPNGASVSMLYYGFIVFTTDRIDHLILFLKMKGQHAKREEMRKQLISFVEYYTEISMLVNDINDSIGIIFAATQNGLIGLMIAVLEYQALLERSAVAFFALTIWLLLQAVACYCGQTLEDASSRLRKQVYNMPWYEMDIYSQKDFKIFHAQIQKGLRLKMKPAIHMNMEHFCKVMNGSYSFLMFLTSLE